MKILLISPLAPPAGGMSTWTKIYLNSRYAFENEVVLINSAVKGKRIKEFKKIKISEEIIRSIKIFDEIKKKINNIDIAHINTSCGKFGIIRDYLYLKYLKYKNIKTIVHYHCNINDMITNKLQRIFLKKIIKNCDINLVLNKKSKKYIEQLTKIKGIIVPNFISSKIFDDLSNILEKNKTLKTIVYTGHISNSKGCKEILEVAEKLKNIEFILIGKIIENYFEKIKMNNVKFLGEISLDEVKKHLKKADLFLFLSHTEGFSISLLEAMSAGLPIIATDVGANRDMIGSNGGIIVNVKDTLGVLKNIKKLQSKKKLRSEMSKYNRIKVKEKYLDEVVLKKIFSIYKAKLK